MNNTRVAFPIITILLLFISCADDQLTPPPVSTNQFSIITELPSSVNESSGLLYSDDEFIWTHNDSGDASNLYKVDLTQNSVLQTLMLENVIHHDWESITQDEGYVYIGDTGNNNGDRTDLTIYKFSTIYLQNTDSVTASSISISYADQNDFSSREKHNFDCEAMVSLGDQLCLFTKNRADLKTNIYRVSKNPGNYIVEQENSLEVEGLITAAAINKQATRICLLGYEIDEEPFRPFLWLISEFQGTDFFNGKQRRINLDLAVQTEGVCFVQDDLIYFSSEAESGGSGFIYQLDLSEYW